MGGDLETFYKIGSDQLDLIRYKNLGEEIRMPLITLVDASFREFHNYIVSGLESLNEVTEEFDGIKDEILQLAVTTADPLIEEFNQLDNKSKEMLQIMNTYPFLEEAVPAVGYVISPLEAVLKIDENGGVKNDITYNSEGDLLYGVIEQGSHSIYKAELENYEDYLGIATEMEVP